MTATPVHGASFTAEKDVPDCIGRGGDGPTEIDGLRPYRSVAGRAGDVVLVEHRFLIGWRLARTASGREEVTPPSSSALT